MPDLDISSPAAEAILGRLASQPGQVVIAPPGEGPGYWAGGPSAVWHEGFYWLAYRLRLPVTEGRGYANVVARSADGVTFETIATVSSEQFSCASLERPSLVVLPGGGWRLYVSCSTWGSKHWWIEAIDAANPADLATGKRTVVMPGDELTAWKDPYIVHGEHGWQMWVCKHPIEDPDTADRMDSWYATSADGLAWDVQGCALQRGGDGWDRRGRRIAAVVEDAGQWTAFYDGRATAEENWEERTSAAIGATPGEFTPMGDDPVGAPAGPDTCLRYLSVVDAPGGGWRLYYESARSDGAHDLRTEYVPRP